MGLFTKKELSAKLNVSIRTIDRLILSGQIKAYKIGRSVRITQEELDDFLEASAYDPYEVGKVSMETGLVSNS